MIVEVYCDGAVRSEGKAAYGAAACAFVIYLNHKPVYRASRLLGEVSSNEAEYEAIIAALLTCVAGDYYSPIIYTDSATAVDQIMGVSACRSRRLVPLLFTVKKIKQVFSFTIQKASREDVKEADSLCNEILDEFQGIVPSQDLDL